jgi:hypothetical protein
VPIKLLSIFIHYYDMWTSIPCSMCQVEASNLDRISASGSCLLTSKKAHFMHSGEERFEKPNEVRYRM